LEPSDFLKTIYLGDRACKSILIDGWKDEVKLQVDNISRVRPETWNYYTAEDLEDGYLVFEGVHRVVWDKVGVCQTTRWSTSRSAHPEFPNADFGSISKLVLVTTTAPRL
jgi:hypothetical protein